jgi:DNA-binding transcriptional MerR regulator
MGTLGGTALAWREGYEDDAGRDSDFSIGEVATLVGVSPHTIRAWERRHKVTVPRRSPAKQRRYTADDVEMLRRVRRESAVRGTPLTGANRRPASRDAEGGRELDASQWRGVADLLPELVLVLEEGVILETNVAVARLTDTLRERLRGLRFVDVVEPFDRAKAVIACLSPLRQRRGWDLNLRTAKGTLRYSFDCQPLWDEGRELLVMVGRRR